MSRIEQSPFGEAIDKLCTVHNIDDSVQLSFDVIKEGSRLEITFVPEIPRTPDHGILRDEIIPKTIAWLAAHHNLDITYLSNGEVVTGHAGLASKTLTPDQRLDLMRGSRRVHIGFLSETKIGTGGTNPRKTTGPLIG